MLVVRGIVRLEELWICGRVVPICISGMFVSPRMDQNSDYFFTLLGV